MSPAAKVSLASPAAGPDHAVDGDQAAVSAQALFQPGSPHPSTTEDVPLPLPWP
ncbi:hypothetical protein [Streptomyces halobius]|uniref:Uncharacterized protein n=1 Tax=Streptomyces halobius TaxID=2879846 RepID=A0ABY4M8G0_9ACTN|nr:hypothetical protein [Streptomyces halobius]UQA92656.1 hypothetical protein K9S39_13195 [Streptomyces halobius]